MPFQSCPDIAEYVIAATYDSQPIANVLHAKLSGGYSQSDVNNLATAVDAWVASDYLALMNSHVTYNEVRVRGLASIIDLQSVVNTSSGAGTMGADALPANVCLCITLRTGLTGRSARGRVYGFPYHGAAQTGINTVSSTYANNLAAAFTNLLGVVISAGWDPVVLSRVTGGAPRTTGIGTTILVADARNTENDSQRGRLPHNH